MSPAPPFRLPAWRDGQSWTYHLERTGRAAFEGRLNYTARRLPDGGWRVEGTSDYPGERSLHEWLELAGGPVRQRAASFERHNEAGVYRYEGRQEPDGSLWLRETRAEVTREETHDARQGPVYISNQLDFMLHGLDMTAGGPWRARMRVENGRVFPYEIRLEGRDVPLVTEDETLPATLVTVRVATNFLVRRLAPPVRYWFHPQDQTMLLRMDHGDTVMTLIEAS